MDKKKTGELIKKVRIEKGYTQIELGDLLGVSNKAVSRWENGDSFPDIGLLESLSRILDLKIQDIVIGEVVESSNDTTVTEIVRVAKIQRKQKTRKAITMGVGYILILYFVIRGYCSLSGIAIEDWITSSIYYSLSTTLLFVSIKSVFDKVSINPFCSKINKCFTGLSLLSGTYISILFGITIMMLKQGEVPFNMELFSVGPFLNSQLIIIWLMNIIMIAVECFRITYNDAAIRLDIYFSIAAIHLIFVYGDLLHRMSPPEEIFEIFVFSTIGIWVETIMVIIMTVVFKKHTLSQFESV